LAGGPVLPITASDSGAARLLFGPAPLSKGYFVP
jgi:hypothetical protein